MNRAWIAYMEEDIHILCTCRPGVVTKVKLITNPLSSHAFEAKVECPNCHAIYSINTQLNAVEEKDSKNGCLD